MSDTRSLVPVLEEGRPAISRRIIWLLCSFFALGRVLGTLFFRSLPLSASIRDLIAVSGGYGATGFLWAWCLAAWPCFVFLFFATSFLGCFLLPTIFFLRGFLLSGSVMLLSRSAFSPGVSFLLLGLPAFFSLSALFLVGEDSFFSSLCLLDSCREKRTAPYTFVSSRRLLSSFVFLLLSAAARELLLPLVI